MKVAGIPILYKVYQIEMFIKTFQETIMWSVPAATEMRFGFEVTMYVMNK